MLSLFHVPTCFKVLSVANVILNDATLKLSYKAFLKDVKVEANFQSRLKVSKQ